MPDLIVRHVKGYVTHWQEVKLDAGAWANLAEDDEDEDGEGDKSKQNGEGQAGDDEDDDGGPDEEKADDLWEQFQSREEQLQQQVKPQRRTFGRKCEARTQWLKMCTR
jgi:hypothetical protein